MDPMIREQIAEIETLRQQLADVTAERDLLRAELLKQPPTLEWLRETFGEPERESSPVKWANGVLWWRGIFCATLGGCCHSLETRAAVLAAVAATKETDDGE